MKIFASVFCRTKVSAWLLASVGFMMVCAVPLTLHATASNGIQVVVKGLNSDQGRVGCGLFKEFAGMWAPIRHGVAVCNFKGVPPATYAVTVLDDNNMDGKMDFGHLGMPKKGYGFSHDAHATFSPPSFDAASITYNGKGNLTVPIDIVYRKL
jgi:uncharacterized protein (DUF2141 family)